MDAGHELDAEVAEKVMGLPVCDKPRTTELPERCNLFMVREHLAPDDLMMPAYSTSIEAAWQVVEHMHGRVVIDHWYGGTYKVIIYVPSSGRPSVEAIGATAPLAICRAALAAVDGGVSLRT
jgi:hypothetical protein